MSYVSMKVRPQNDDPVDSRRYVRSYSITLTRDYTLPTQSSNPDEFVILASEVPKDFFKDPHKYYIDNKNRLRKNPKRTLS